MKQFIGTCVENPFDTVGDLCQVVETARNITRQTFLKHCIVTPVERADFNSYIYDYGFYKYSGVIGKDIYFYTWSAIEHFYT